MGLKVGLIRQNPLIENDVIGLFELFPVHLGVPDGLTGHECPDMLD